MSHIVGRVFAATGVGDQVRQRVDLDDVDDAQAGVLRVGQDRGDRVDVLGLVAVDLGGPELTVGGERRAVTAGQVVDDELDDSRRPARAPRPGDRRRPMAPSAPSMAAIRSSQTPVGWLEIEPPPASAAALADHSGFT